MVKPLLFAVAIQAFGAPAFAQEGGREPSLQSPPFATPAFTPAPQAAKQTPAADQAPSFGSVASEFDPSKQHFIWVLPPGLHGKGPWGFTATVKADGAQQFQTTLPLIAQTSQGGSRPEYPAGFEVVRLTGDGAWAQNTAGVDKAIKDVIAKFGRGHGELNMTNELHLSVDTAGREAYCRNGKTADIRIYLEEAGKTDLVRLDDPGMSGIFQHAITTACAQ